MITEQLLDKPESRSNLINTLHQAIRIIKDNRDNFSYTTEEHQEITYLIMELLGCQKSTGTNFNWEHSYFPDGISITTNTKDNILIELASDFRNEGYESCKKNIQKALGIS